MCGIRCWEPVLDDLSRTYRKCFGCAYAASGSDGWTKPSRLSFNGKEEREKAEAKSKATTPHQPALVRQTRHIRSVT
jgi:hypothetical protein